MNKMSKSLIAVSVLAATALGSSAAIAEVSANIGVTSNYIWRGVTQSSDQASVSGGVDYAHDSGLYLGTWTANMSAGAELDLYLGFAGEAGPLGYDVGYIQYMYPNDDTLDFGEAYVGVSYSLFSTKVSYDSENKNMYAEVGLDFDLGEGFGVGLHGGSYDFDAGTDYTDYSVSLSKDDFTLAVSDTSENVAYGQTDNYRVAVSWGKSF